MPSCSDSNLIMMAAISECRSWARETALLHGRRAQQQRFPVAPERSCFNRPRRDLRHAINVIRLLALTVLDVTPDRQCTVDSLSVPVPRSHHMPAVPSAGTCRAAVAVIGTVPTKQQTTFSDKLHLLVTLGEMSRDFALALTSVSDVAVGTELLREQTDLTIVGDKGDSGAPLANEQRAASESALLTVPRRNQCCRVPQAVARWLDGTHQSVETVNGQLTKQFGFGRHQARTFLGLCARLSTKLATHPLRLLQPLAGTDYPASD